jgi:hypothetical protein
MQTRFDLYLARVSNIVQVGLFVVALCTIYYTVIPLYKSAQIEESLAKKEIEYQKLTEKVDNLYVKNRNWKVHDLSLVLVECAGWDSVIHQESYSFSWDSDMVGCLQAKRNGYDLSDIELNDVKRIDDKLNDISIKVLAARSGFQEKYSSYESDLRKNPLLAPASAPMDEEIDSLGRSLGLAEKEIQKRKFESNVMRGQSEIVNAFLRHVTDVIMTLRDIEWQK